MVERKVICYWCGWTGKESKLIKSEVHDSLGYTSRALVKCPNCGGYNIQQVVK